MAMELAEKTEGVKAGKNFETFNKSTLHKLKTELERIEGMGVFWPFEFEIIETLDSMRDEPAAQELIEEKMDVLKNILEGMDQERERQEEMKEIYRLW